MARRTSQPAGLRAGGVRPVYVSGECEIDLARRELRVLGSPVPLGGRAFEMIEILARSAGELVTKDELMNSIWPGAIVMENTLQVHAAALRKALGPYRDLLKTESRRGYRLLGEWNVRRRETAAPPAGFQRLPAGGQPPASNLPAPVTRLVGRSPAVRRLQDLVSAYRVVTVTGPGGIGKTVLALEAARGVLGEFADGGWLVELASLSDPDLVPSAVAGVLGLKLGSATISPEVVARAVAGKRLLLVLDNCEHVIDAAATLAEAFVRLCPGATILTTSREVLRIEGEHAYRVPPLDVPATERVDPDDILAHSATALFVARAEELGSDVSSHAESLPIAAICRHLDGIPLAIEFAAARAATLGVEQVAAGLHDRFALLTGGRRRALPRHRTLRATLDWSYQLLPAGEQQLFRWLSVFPSSISLTAAIQILAGWQSPSSVMDGVSSLVEKSLLNVDEATSVIGYRMLETTREYARIRLVECGEIRAAARQHALHVRDTVLRIGAEPGSGVAEAGDPSGDAALKPEEIHNVRSALDWCFSPDGDAGTGVEITAAYAGTWLHMSLMTECRARVEAALGRLSQTSASELKRQLYIALSIALVHTTGLVEDTQASVERALAMTDSSADDIDHLPTLWAIWDYQSNSREYSSALKTAGKFHQMASRSEDRSAIVVADRLLGHSLYYRGEQTTARFYLEQVLALEAMNQTRTVWFQYDQRVLAGTLLARVLWLVGYPDKAMATADTFCAEAVELGHKLSQCYAQSFAAFPVSCWIGNVAAARQALDACARLAGENDLSFYRKWSECLRGMLLVEQGDFRVGVAVLSDALPTLGIVGSRQPEFQMALARGLAGAGDHTRAWDVLGAALTHAKSHGEYWCVPELLRLRSEILIARDQGGSDVVERQLRIALRLAHKQGARSWALRAATSLAQYLHSRGDRRHESYRILETVADQFTEGFSTADLLTARGWLANHR